MNRLALCVAILSLAVSARGGANASTPPSALAPAAAPASVVPRAETLEGVSAAFAEARARGDDVRLLQLAQSLLPSNDDLKKVLRTGAETDSFLRQYDADAIRERAEALSNQLLLPGDATQTVVKVHSSTTEEIVQYKPGSIASAEFPGGMRRFASRVAAAGRTWQVIEYLAPGETAGTKYSCFTVLEGRVILLIKPWRALER